MAESEVPTRYADSTPPDLEGPHGKAWMCDTEEIVRRNGNKPHASVCGWIVEARWAHPVWHSYLIAVIHLRQVEGGQAPNILLSGATHEIMVYALNPEYKRALNDTVSFLTPANFHGQWIARDDAAAAEKCKQCVIDILHGKLSPDTDFTQHWIKLFSASNIKGDPSTAGETRVLVEIDGEREEIVIPPVPPPPTQH